MIRFFLVLVLLPVLVWGCAGQPEGNDTPLPRADVLEQAPSSPPSQEAVKTAEERQQEQLEAQISQDQAELAARGPDMLIGLDREALSAFLGKPHFVRQDDPAVVWLYESPVCFLDVFFYSPEEWRENMRDYMEQKRENGDAPPYRVTFYNVRGRDGANVTSLQCLSEFISQRADLEIFVPAS